MIKNGLFIIAFLSGFYSFSQQSFELAFGHEDPVIQDSVSFYDYLTVDCFIKNTGTDTIFSTIRLMITANPDGGDIVARELLSFSFDLLGFPPGDSVHIPAPTVQNPTNGAFDVVLTSNNYSGGDNIIVVWPVIDGNSSFSSEQYNKGVFVNQPTSIEPQVIDDLKVLTSSYGFISVQSSVAIDKLLLYNMEGKLMQTSSTSKISTTKLTSGIYLLKVFQNDRYVSRSVFVN
jgi:hypothetical protein